MCVWGRSKEARADVRCQSLSETLNVELTDWTRLAAEQAPGSLPSPFLSSDIAAPAAAPASSCGCWGLNLGPHAVEQALQQD